MIRVQDPHNVEAEQAFLGSILQEPKTISRASRLVRPADFFDERHAFIWQAMLDTEQAGQPLDLVTLSDRLNGNLADVGGAAYLIQLAHIPMTSAENLDTYAAIIRKYARLRRLINGCGRIVRLAHRAGANVNVMDEALALAESTLLALVKEDRLGRVAPLGVLIRRYLDRAKAQPLGLSTGLPALDALSGRLQPGDLVLLAGEPGTFKTSLALRIAKGVGMAGRKVALFSLESSSDQVVQRLLADETGLDAQRLRIGDLDPALHQAGGRLAELGIYVDDTPGLLIAELRSKARWLHYLWGLDLIIVNYLQLLRSDQKHDSRAEELAAACRALKALARELKLPLIAVFRFDPTCPPNGECVDNRAVEVESDLIWLCEKRGDHLLLTQTRWRDGPAGASIELEMYERANQGTARSGLEGHAGQGSHPGPAQMRGAHELDHLAQPPG
ncbi:MAG: replicative DNA helicase [Chloroflexota bacterium]|nr:MAG: replicative DNA helicase [Chloroflexota bacterium]